MFEIIPGLLDSISHKIVSLGLNLESEEQDTFRLHLTEMIESLSNAAQMVYDHLDLHYFCINSSDLRTLMSYPIEEQLNLHGCELVLNDPIYSTSIA